MISLQKLKNDFMLGLAQIEAVILFVPGPWRVQKDNSEKLATKVEQCLSVDASMLLFVHVLFVKSKSIIYLFHFGYQKMHNQPTY